MGKPNTNAGERGVIGDVHSGSLSATGSSNGYTFGGPFNIFLSGTWVGTVALEASADGGSTYVNCLLPDLTANSITTNGMVAVPYVYEDGVLFRLTFTRTSGTVNWRMSR